MPNFRLALVARTARHCSCLDHTAQGSSAVLSSLVGAELCVTPVILPRECNQLCPVSMAIWKTFYFKHLLQNHTISKATLLDRTADTVHRLSTDIPCQEQQRQCTNKHSSSFPSCRYLSVILQRRVLKQKISPKEKHKSFKGAQEGPVQEGPPLQHGII